LHVGDLQIVASERTRRADARADREARKTGVEGQEAGTGESAPGNEQATTAPPEAAQEGNSGEPKKWTQEQRAAAIDAERDRQARIDAERERRAQIERDRGSNDNDPGRTREP
jgi:hypothetical protein